MKNTIVVFIHGFTGGKNTWVNEKGESFLEYLRQLPELSDMDFCEFLYYTKILNFTSNTATKIVAGIVNKVLPSRFKLKTPVIKKNTPIAEIAQELITHIKYELSDYSNIIFVSHSMGGLVSKCAIIDLVNTDVTFEHDILGYCSLATPHKGSIPSILMGPFNVNANEMKPLDADNSKLNDKWVDYAPGKLKTLYVRAKSDEVVEITSSTPNSDVKKFPFEVIEADHTSICKPQNNEDKICKVVRKFLLDCLSKAKIKNMALDEFPEKSSSYDKEVFVIKLILADVDQLLIEDAKDSFFLAEICEKQANKSDRESIKELTSRVISIYRILAGSGEYKSSNKLVSEIHKKVLECDKHALACAIDYINFMHKKGFLHQHANKNNLAVNWSSEVTIDDVAKYRKSLDD